MDELLWFLVQLVFEIFGEILFGIVWELLVSLYRITFDRANWGILGAIVGYFALGAATGGASLYFWPEHVFHTVRIPGLSLVLSPLVAGWALVTWGDFRRGRGHVTSSLATFSGGAAFAFGAALVRFIWAK